MKNMIIIITIILVLVLQCEGDSSETNYDYTLSKYSVVPLECVGRTAACIFALEEYPVKIALGWWLKDDNKSWEKHCIAVYWDEEGKHYVDVGSKFVCIIPAQVIKTRWCEVSLIGQSEFFTHCLNKIDGRLVPEKTRPSVKP